MNISARERILTLLTLLIILYGVTGMLAPRWLRDWNTARAARENTTDELARRRNLVAQHDQWERLYEEQRARLPVFERHRPVVTHWLGIMDRVAAENGLRILRRQAGEESPVGEVFELPIECREWEGSLESLVRFLYHLNREEAMMDVRQMLVRVRDPSRPDALTGRFTLFCAYLRESEPAIPPMTSPHDGP